MTVANHDLWLEQKRMRQRGAVSWQFLLTMLIIILLVNAGYHYIPLAYNTKAYEDVMQQTVNQAALLPTSGNQDAADVTQKQLKRLAAEYNLPEDVSIKAKQIEGQHNVQATVEFNEPVALLPFSLYDYDYQFSRTVKSKNLLN